MPRSFILIGAMCCAIASSSCIADERSPATMTANSPEQVIAAHWKNIAPGSADKDEYWRARRELEQMASDGNGAEIVKQVLILTSNEDPGAMNLMYLLVYIPRLMLLPDAILEGAVPLLGRTNADPVAPAETLLNLMITGQPSWISNDDISEYFRQNCKQPPLRFVGFLSSFAPRSALLSLDKAYPDPERHRIVIWAEHVVSDSIWKHQNHFPQAGSDAAATSQLAILAKRPEWWVRLYAAEIMRLNPWLAEKKLVEQLRRDDHELVRAVGRDQ